MSYRIPKFRNKRRFVDSGLQGDDVTSCLDLACVFLDLPERSRTTDHGSGEQDEGSRNRGEETHRELQ